MSKSIDGHNTYYREQSSTKSIAFYPNGTRGNLFIEMTNRSHRGKPTFECRALFRAEVEYLVAALQQHLEETKDGKPWWERDMDGDYPNATSQEGGIS